MKKNISLLVVSLSVFHCASVEEKPQTHTDHCAALVQEATNEIADDANFHAKELLNNVLNNCSGTGFMEEAQYTLAQAYFSDEEWIDARAEYGMYADHYPNSPKTPSALYKKAVSAFHSPFKQGRDGSMTEVGIEDFDEFMQAFPESPKLDSAVYYKSELLERMAEAEIDKAQLYLNMREPQAAAIYLKTFLKNYNFSKFYVEAHYMLIESYNRLDQFDQAKAFHKKLIHEFPDLASTSRAQSSLKNIENLSVDFSERIKTEKKKTLQKRNREL